jgi:hypothetical protein
VLVWLIDSKVIFGQSGLLDLLLGRREYLKVVMENERASKFLARFATIEGGKSLKKPDLLFQLSRVGNI